MSKSHEYFVFLASIIIFVWGQFLMQSSDIDKTVPFLLSAIVLALWAIYLQKGNKQ
jgi:hypothetical protein